MSDATFADLLLADADTALAGFDLTSDEKSALKSMSHAEFEQFASASPEERKSFSTFSDIKIGNRSQFSQKG